MTFLCHLSSCLSVSLLSVNDCGIYLGPSLGSLPFPPHPGVQSKWAWGGVGPVLSLKAPSWKSGDKGSGWPSSKHRTPPAGRCCSAAHNPAPPLPSCHHSPLCSAQTRAAQPGPVSWMVLGGAVGQLGKSTVEACCTLSLSTVLGLWASLPSPPTWDSWLHYPWTSVSPEDTPCGTRPPSAHLQPFLSMGVRAHLPLQPTPQKLSILESHCFSKKPPGSPGERGMDIYFLKFAVHL